MMQTRFRGLLPLLCGAFALLLCAGSAPAGVVLPVVDESGSVIVTTETAEVREGPASGYDVITVVAKGEIFFKQGRTGAWYYIRINEDTFGWISGRAISRYLEDETPSTYVEPRDAPIDGGDYPYYPYYPDSYYSYFYDYPFYFWGQPYFSSDYYYYDNYRYRSYSRGYGSGYPRNRYFPRDRVDGRPGGGDSHRNYNGGGYRAPAPMLPRVSPRLNIPHPGPSGPRIGPPGRRR